MNDLDISVSLIAFFIISFLLLGSLFSGSILFAQRLCDSTFSPTTSSRR
jgi:hypothetical protein